MRRVLVVLPFALAGAAACTGLDGLTGDPNAADASTGGVDGSTPGNDGGSASDGTSNDVINNPIVDGGEAGIVPGNLVTNGSFEQGSGGCGPGWRTDRTTMTRSTMAHTGAYSCLVCIVPGNTIGNVFPLNNNLGNAKKDEAYFAELWVAAPPSGTGGTNANMSFQVFVNDEGIGYNNVDPQPAWQVVQIQGTAKTDGILDLAIRVNPFDAGGDGCFLVDDVVVVKQ